MHFGKPSPFPATGSTIRPARQRTHGWANAKRSNRRDSDFLFCSTVDFMANSRAFTTRKSWAFPMHKKRRLPPDGKAFPRERSSSSIRSREGACYRNRKHTFTAGLMRLPPPDFTLESTARESLLRRVMERRSSPPMTSARTRDTERSLTLSLTTPVRRLPDARFPILRPDPGKAALISVKSGNSLSLRGGEISRPRAPQTTTLTEIAILPALPLRNCTWMWTQPHHLIRPSAGSASGIVASTSRFRLHWALRGCGPAR